MHDVVTRAEHESQGMHAGTLETRVRLTSVVTLRCPLDVRLQVIHSTSPVNRRLWAASDKWGFIMVVIALQCHGRV